jgi:hypothetical protein
MRIRAAFLPNFLANIDIEGPAANRGRPKETLHACPATEISPSSPPETCPSIRWRIQWFITTPDLIEAIQSAGWLKIKKTRDDRRSCVLEWRAMSRA